MKSKWHFLWVVPVWLICQVVGIALFLFVFSLQIFTGTLGLIGMLLAMPFNLILGKKPEVVTSSSRNASPSREP